MESEVEMTKHAFSVAYAGKDRSHDHSIDVETLAPALLAFGKLMREANAEFNGKKSFAKVLVVSDFEHKCFNINFELIVSLYDQLKTLLDSDALKTAKDILELLGVFGVGSTGTLSYLKYLEWKKGRKVVKKQEVTDQDKSGVVVVKIEGEKNSIHVTNQVFNLSENPKALRATRDALMPIGHDGFDKVEFRSNGRLLETVKPKEVDDIILSCTTGIAEAKEIEPETEETTAWLSVYSPVYDSSAENWRFRFGKEVIYADISETNIAEEALLKGGAGSEDAYLVKLQITTPVDAQGKKLKPIYKITEVIRFVSSLPLTQMSFTDKLVTEKAPKKDVPKLTDQTKRPKKEE